MLMILYEYRVLFFFFKQKTAYEMRISDWSSDVCSSDLRGPRHRLVSKPRLRRRRALTVFPQRRRAMPKMIFVNLPVADVERSTAFYEAIGFEKNAKFSNEQASSMLWSDSLVVMQIG